MNDKQLLVDLSIYRYLKDFSGYNAKYTEKIQVALDLVLEQIISDIIDEEIHSTGE